MWLNNDSLFIASFHHSLLSKHIYRRAEQGAKSLNEFSESPKSWLAPATEQGQPVLCLKQSMKNALLNSKVFVFVFFLSLIYYPQSIKKCVTFCFLNVLFRFPLCTSLQHPQNWGINRQVLYWCQFLCPKGLAFRTLWGLISHRDLLHSFQSQWISYPCDSAAVC